MKTKLLLTISLICLLVTSTQAAVPFEYFSNMSEADGETPGAQIPNCINQRGYMCLACGPDTSQTPAVPLFPNVLHQCIPNPSGSGCNRFQDIQGNVCDLNNGCNCKFVIDSYATTCVATKIPNCFILNADGTCAQCIGVGRTGSYDQQDGTSVTLVQTVPVGGGVNDYGRSFDGNNCIDNLANGNPNCQEYLNATSCNKCDTGFTLVQTGTPSASLRKCIRIKNPVSIGNCFAWSLDGQRCITCGTNYIVSATGTCVANPNEPAFTANRVASNCLRWAKGVDGQENYRKCLKCVNFSFLLKEGSCSVLVDNEDVEIDYVTGATSNLKGGFCRLFYRTSFADQTNSDSNTEFQYCMVKKAPNDFYVATTPVTSTDVPRSDLNCVNYDTVSGKCLKCNNNYYLNTLDGACISTSDATCPLLGCLTSNGAAYCTECALGYSKVDGRCYPYNLGDSTTNSYCQTITNGECSECDPQFFLDVNDSMGFSKRNRCRLLDNGDGCSTWVAGRCTACTDAGKVVVKGDCQWAPDTNFGGVPGCAIHSADGVCQTPYDNAFLSTDKKSTYIVSGLCGGYDGDGNCTKTNHIKAILNFDYPTGQWVALLNSNGGNYCEKSYDNGCTCVTCQTTWTLNSNKQCLPNVDGSLNNILPDTVIRGCVQFATATTCDTCRSPDFIKTTDGLCYDLRHFRKATGVNGWQRLFIQLNTGGNTGAAADTADYNPGSLVYEACTAASTIYACTTCFAARPNNIFSVTFEAGDTSYFGSAITYCHDNTNSVFKSLVASTSILINDGLSGGGTRDTTAKQLDRVVGCISYTSLVLGTCKTCATGRTKNSAETICYNSDGSNDDGITTQYCGSVDPATGKCLTCIDTQSYIYDSTNQVCTLKAGSSYAVCLTQDVATGLCLTCPPAYVANIAAATKADQCKSVRTSSRYTDGSGAGFVCNQNVCSVGTAKFMPINGLIGSYFQVETCGLGYTQDSNNRCVRNSKPDFATSVAELDAQTGFFLTCASGFTLFKSGTYTLCLPAINNCQTHAFNAGTNIVSCTQCASDANGIPYFYAAGARQCVRSDIYSPLCDTYNSSGTACLICDSDAKNLEAVGCKLPPNCNKINGWTLKCKECKATHKLTPGGDCILIIPNKWADADCQVAFNATHCASCTNSKIIAIDDLENDGQYGVGECVSLTAPSGCSVSAGCELILRSEDQDNCKLTTYECIRCQVGYSLFGGKCYDNESSDNRFPFNCVNVEYDEDKQAYVCTECDHGYAITTDRQQCIPNYGPCSYLDSTDCAHYEQPQPHEEVQTECADERESSSIIMSAALLMIINIIFFSI